MSFLSFFSENTDFELVDESKYNSWIENVILAENQSVGNLSFVFCDDEYLHKINLEYLNHDTYTDIITFDYTESGVVSGDIFISIERVQENGGKFEVSFKKELSRVIIHGILHLLGYKDKTEEE